MSGQVVDSRDLAIFFNNKVFRNPFSNVLEKIMEYFTEEGSYCKVCGFTADGILSGPTGAA